MRIFVADDDPVCRRMLEASLLHWKHEVVVANDGDEAWRILQSPDAPNLAILDWMMPGLNGVAVCKKVREARPLDALYLIVLTTKGGHEDLLTGLDAGTRFTHCICPECLSREKGKLKATTPNS